ncbi:hypothetical protein ABW19_dt0210390 [Dactylella cylindrospora]|nr:hypothetical protein ABW19_dt0210390 [Dactylella cylindrospora]
MMYRSRSFFILKMLLMGDILEPTKRLSSVWLTDRTQFQKPSAGLSNPSALYSPISATTSKVFKLINMFLYSSTLEGGIVNQDKGTPLGSNPEFVTCSIFLSPALTADCMTIFQTVDKSDCMELILSKYPSMIPCGNRVPGL